MTDLLTLNNISKSLCSESEVKKNIIKDLSFNIPFSEKGSITSIIAPFGAGKTTLLKIIAGIESYDSGNIKFIDSEQSVKPLIPENNSNLPWLDVKENITLWKKFNNEIISDERLNQLIEDVGLTNYEKFHAQNINSGFQFRISLARALTFNPKIILIDDAFKNLDVETRTEIYKMLNYIVDKYHINLLLATTNLIEAVFLSNQILLMSKRPAGIFYEMPNQNDYEDIQSMIASQRFKLIAQKVQTQFQNNSGIALIHYSV